MPDLPAPPDDAFLLGSFPATLRNSVASTLAVIPSAGHRPVGYFEVVVSGDSVTLPSRIYNPEPDASGLMGLSDVERLILSCIYTRHHNGHVRQRHLEAIVTSTEQWVVPFVVNLVGEYVVEIIAVIEGELDGLVPGSIHHGSYSTFARENLPFLKLTEARANSYWNEYYRRQFPDRTMYPGARVIAALLQLRRETAPQSPSEIPSDHGG